MPSSAPATELLAPAGDWECLRAAAANGADAVYFGLQNFNARHRAVNFSLAALPEVMRFLHDRNLRGYVTLNTLAFPEELSELAETIEAISAAGADAVIVQDLGVARLIARLAPDLPIHGSTQMTLTEPQGIEFVRELGVERVILARELSIADVRKIKAEIDLPVEVFIHGALCVAYSGQCLTSEALGGRSANRGQCAQACRLPYDLIVDGQHRDLADYAYLLSPQDLAAHDLVGELVQAGVASLKIEGRLKSAQYVAAVTSAYRAALDAALAGRSFSLGKQERLDLSQSFSRGFTPGFLEGVDHRRLVAGRFPKSRGVHVGTLVERTPRGCVVQLDPEHDGALLKPGDGIVFDEGRPDQDEQGGRLVAVRPHALDDGGNGVLLEFMAGAVNEAAVSIGAQVWRTDDPDFRRRMERTYRRASTVHRRKIDFVVAGRVGAALRLTATNEDGASAAAEWPGPLAAARVHAATPESLAEQLGRLGETPFKLGRVETDLPEPTMIPKSVVNNLRRRVVEELLAGRDRRRQTRRIERQALDVLRAAAREPFPGDGEANQDTAPKLYVLARTREQLDAVIAWRPPAGLERPALVWLDFEDVRRYRDAVAVAHDGGLPAGVAALRVVKPGEEKLLRIVAQSGAHAVLVRNLATRAILRREHPEMALVADFSLNAANELTADLLLRSGFVRFTPSYDLDWEQFQALARRSRPERFEAVVHQHIPMFYMEHCVYAAALSDGKDFRDCGRPCDVHRVELRDRTGAEFPLAADAGCRNTVYNSQAQSAAEYVSRMRALGVRHFRVELLRETGEQTGPLLDRYARVLAGLDDGRRAWRGLQVLQQLGVTRGTLAVR